MTNHSVSASIIPPVSARINLIQGRSNSAKTKSSRDDDYWMPREPLDSHARLALARYDSAIREAHIRLRSRIAQGVNFYCPSAQRTTARRHGQPTNLPLHIFQDHVRRRR